MAQCTRSKSLPDRKRRAAKEAYERQARRCVQQRRLAYRHALVINTVERLENLVPSAAARDFCGLAAENAKWCQERTS